MCLCVNEKLIKTFIASKRKEYTFYKMFVIGENKKCLITPYMDKKILTCGIKKAKGNFNECEGVIHGGVCHSFAVKPTFDMIKIYNGCCCPIEHRKCRGIFFSKSYFGETIVIIPIKVHYKDIIAFGNHNDVCFKKYEIEKRIWDRLFNYLKNS